jgi:hypothetical protein
VQCSYSTASTARRKGNLTASEGSKPPQSEHLWIGTDVASKSRILLYIAGDVFTIGISELVFWPLELALLDGTEGRAVATYGSDNKDQIVKITTKYGKPWEH